MFADNLRTHSLSESVARTFDGKYPCPICKAIAAAKKSQKKSEFTLQTQKLGIPSREGKPGFDFTAEFSAFADVGKSSDGISRPKTVDAAAARIPRLICFVNWEGRRVAVAQTEIMGRRHGVPPQKSLTLRAPLRVLAILKFGMKNKNKKNNSAAVKMGCGLLAGMLAPAWFMPARAGAVFLTWRQVRCFRMARAEWPGCNTIIRTKIAIGAALGMAPAANNGDKKIETNFVTLGLQYMFNHTWGAQIELPYCSRTFTAPNHQFPDAPSQWRSRKNWSSLGDIRLEGIYTGFFADLSAGVTFGLKLPTGNWTHAEAHGVIDRDSKWARAARTFCSADFIAATSRRMKNGTGSRRDCWTFRR